MVKYYEDDSCLPHTIPTTTTTSSQMWGLWGVGIIIAKIYSYHSFWRPKTNNSNFQLEHGRYLWCVDLATVTQLMCMSCKWLTMKDLHITVIANNTVHLTMLFWPFLWFRCILLCSTYTTCAFQHEPQGMTLATSMQATTWVSDWVSVLVLANTL